MDDWRQRGLVLFKMISQTAESGQDQERGRKANSDSDMQGQLEHHENQVSSRDSSSTTAAMDDSQPAPPSTSTAPYVAYPYCLYHAHASVLQTNSFEDNGRLRRGLISPLCYPFPAHFFLTV